MIRFAEKGDIPYLLKLLYQVGKVHNTIRPDLFRDTPCKYDAPALEALLQDPTRPIFVLAEEDAVLGYAFCILEEIKNDPVLRDQKTCYIDDLCVDEDCRGKHVGKQLYEHVLDYAKSIGCNSVTLNVWCGNDSAMAFYEKCGLKPRKIYMEYPLEEG